MIEQPDNEAVQELACVDCGHVDSPINIGPGPGWMAIILWVAAAALWTLGMALQNIWVGYLAAPVFLGCAHLYALVLLSPGEGVPPLRRSVGGGPVGGPRRPGLATPLSHGPGAHLPRSDRPEGGAPDHWWRASDPVGPRLPGVLRADHPGPGALARAAHTTGMALVHALWLARTFTPTRPREAPGTCRRTGDLILPVLP